MVHSREDQIILLNQDLMGEHQAIIHYLTHAWTVVKQFGPNIEAIARDEMRHFKWLAHSIVAIGGTPDLTPPEVLPLLNGMEAIQYDIDAEEEAISQYLAHQRDIADDRIQTLIGRIVVDERDHRRQFVELKERYAEPSPQNEDTPSEHIARRLETLVSKEYQEILRYLLESFLSRHTRQVGLNSEEKAVEEMRHLAWVAEALADIGGAPQFVLHAGETWEDEMALYEQLRSWANTEMAPMVPLIDRIISHERYQQKMSRDSEWTVGSAVEGGNNSWTY